MLFQLIEPYIINLNINKIYLSISFSNCFWHYLLEELAILYAFLLFSFYKYMTFMSVTDTQIDISIKKNIALNENKSYYNLISN